MSWNTLYTTSKDKNIKKKRKKQTGTNMILFHFNVFSLKTKSEIMLVLNTMCIKCIKVKDYNCVLYRTQIVYLSKLAMMPKLME